MVATMVVRLLGLAILVVVVGTVAALWRQAMRSPWFLPAGKRKQGPLGSVRIACGVLGALLVVAVGVGTWQTARASYRPLPPGPAMTLKTPTRSVDLAWLPDGSTAETVRILATLVVLETRAGDVRPVHVEQFEIRWPGQRINNVKFGLDGLECFYQLNLRGIEVQQGAVKVVGQHWMYMTRPWGTSRSSDMGSLEIGGVLLGPVTTDLSWPNPLSVTPPTGGRYICDLKLLPVAADDPLRTVPLIEGILGQGAFADPITNAGFARSLPAGGIRLADYLGLTAWVLVAAVMLLSQVFRRRDVALAGITLLMVLYVAGLDRAVLAYDMSQLRDASASRETRLVAQSRTAASFFFRETAGRP